MDIDKELQERFKKLKQHIEEKKNEK